MLRNIIFLVAIHNFVEVSGHALLYFPPARHFMWLYPYTRFDPLAEKVSPAWYDLHGVWCGDEPKEDQDWTVADTNYTECGRCGYHKDFKRFNQGGDFGNDVVLKESRFVMGQTIDALIEIYTAHWGFSEFELCPEFEETDNCFQKLEIIGGSDKVIGNERICMSSGGSFGGVREFAWAKVKLPENVVCDRCTLRWTYRASSFPWHRYNKTHTMTYGEPPFTSWDPCYDPLPTQVFRNCADISIRREP